MNFYWKLIVGIIVALIFLTIIMVDNEKRGLIVFVLFLIGVGSLWIRHQNKEHYSNSVNAKQKK